MRKSGLPSRTLLIAILLATAAAAQEPVASEPAAAMATAPAEEPAAVPAASATPFDAAAATRAYLDRLTPEEKARSDAYFEGGYWLQLWGLLYGLGVAWLLLGTRLAAGMRDLAQRLTRRGPLQTFLFGVQYVVLATVLAFPLTVYQGFYREHQYGLATQAFGGWLRDQAVALGVNVVLTPIFLIFLYGVVRKARRTWWLWGSVVTVLFLVFSILIAPVYIDPLFNKYEPLADERVKDSILSLARSNGIEVDDVYQFDASRQSNRISANVSGFMGTMRIRLNDNLLDRCTRSEIEAVMGHEIGHYVLNHIYELLVYLGLIVVVGFAFIHRSFDRVVTRWGANWRVQGIGDLAGLPVIVALFSLYGFVLTPVFNTIIRSNEAEADLFGLNASREPEGFAEVALKLGEYRKLDPGPIEEWIFFDHPSGRARIRMAMDWRAEHPEGAP